MRPVAIIRGVLGTLLVVGASGIGCSSTDSPPSTNPDAGSGGKQSGSAGKTGAAGKGGKASGGGAEAGGGGAESAGESAGGSGGEANGGDAGSAGDAGSGGQAPAIIGCKTGGDCASGVCSAAHDCQNCLSDQECGAEHVCGAQTCATACTAAQEGTSAGCGTGLTCCSLHCVDTTNDSAHCGMCGTACSVAQFCGKSGCVSNQVSSVCQIPKVAIVLDGQVGDDPVGRAIGQMLIAQCPTPPPVVREVMQSVADVLNPATGQPVAGGDELLVLAGGNAVQSAAGFLTTGQVAPLSNVHITTTPEKFQIVNTATAAVIAEELTTAATDSHDLFAVQFIRDAKSGSLLLNAYGFTAGGTAAASVYLDKVLLPSLSTATKSWYVGVWTDADGDKTPDLNELVLTASGG